MKENEKRPLYIWQHPDWPHFKWNKSVVEPLLNSVAERQARLLGMLLALGFDTQQQTALETLTEDVLRSAEIEGEALNRDSVRSSIARRLGISVPTYVGGDLKSQLDAAVRYISNQ